MTFWDFIRSLNYRKVTLVLFSAAVLFVAVQYPQVTSNEIFRAIVQNVVAQWNGEHDAP